MRLVNRMRADLGTYAQGQPSYAPTGRIWPNGEFSLGYSIVGQESEADSEWAWTRPERYLRPDELDQRLEAMHELLTEAESWWTQSAALVRSGLSLSIVWNSHKPTTARKNGLKGLTGYGAKMLRSGCFLLESKLGKEDCVMVTLTVPTVGRDARRAIAQNWGVLTNRLVQYLTRALVKAGRTPAIVGCVEIQSARLVRYGQGYLHLHLVMPAHSNTGGVWAIKASALRSWWKKAIERVIGCQLTSLPRIETAIVEKSVEAYLGKYLSKGSGEELEQFVGDLGEDSVPGQWWVCSGVMRDAIIAGTKVGRNAGALLDALINHVRPTGEFDGFEYIAQIDCEIHGKKYPVGWVGRLTPEMRLELQSMLKST
jgi:hypothetical protein